MRCYEFIGRLHRYLMPRLHDAVAILKEVHQIVWCLAWYGCLYFWWLLISNRCLMELVTIFCSMWYYGLMQLWLIYIWSLLWMICYGLTLRFHVLRCLRCSCLNHHGLFELRYWTIVVICNGLAYLAHYLAIALFWLFWIFLSYHLRDHRNLNLSYCVLCSRFHDRWSLLKEFHQFLFHWLSWHFFRLVMPRHFQSLLESF